MGKIPPTEEAKKQAFRAALVASTPNGRAATYAEEVWRVSMEEAVNPCLIVAIMERETLSGTAEALDQPGPGGRGDGGHGHGLMQIDDRFHAAFLASGLWKDAYENFKYAIAQVLKPNLVYFKGKGLVGDQCLRAAVAAYNAGPSAVWKALQAGHDVDSPTANHNYSADVFSRFATLTQSYQQRIV